ncbi:MAG: FtsW/RodA/SpoVE family cell cycle protein [bacterium]
MSSVAGGSVAKEAYLVRQSYWFIAGIGLALLTQFIHYRDWARLGFILHLLVILLLVLVLFYGTGGPGTSVQRWLKIGPFFIQPSEFSKFTLVLAVSHYFREDNRFLQQGWIWMAWPTLLMLIPVVLIIRQPDLGTALLLIVIFAPIVFMMGIRFRTILSVTGLIWFHFLWFGFTCSNPISRKEF